MARILIIEDDNVSAAILTDTIKQYAPKKYTSDWSLRITHTTTAIEALELLKIHDFELVITDILMARVDGWELITEIRKTRTSADLPIIVVSAIDGVELEYNSKRVGASLWFTKPINPEEFAEKVFMLIEER